MFYHGNCPPCREAMPQFLALRHEFTARSQRIDLALVELPPFERSPRAQRSEPYLCGRLSGAIRPLRTPLFVLIDDGVVNRVADLPAALLDQKADSSSESAFPDYIRARRELFLKEIACGPLALLAVCNELGVVPSPEEMESLLAAAGAIGTDMLQLKQLAGSKGLYSVGVSITLDGLRRLDRPTIVHLNDVSFAAIVGYPTEGVRIVFPLAQPGILPNDVFERAFGRTGNALIVSRSEVPARSLRLTTADAEPQASGPHLRLSRSMLTAGRTHSRTWAAETMIYNDGTADLEILDLVPLCLNYTTSVDRKQIPPGGSTVLRVHGRLRCATMWKRPSAPSALRSHSATCAQE